MKCSRRCLFKEVHSNVHNTPEPMLLSNYNAPLNNNYLDQEVQSIECFYY